jgi:UDP-N-acetylmuramoylalanine-D-glutamate ligase
MALDAGTVAAHAARLLPAAPPCQSRGRGFVDGYVKAFYEHSEGALLAWVAAHRAGSLDAAVALAVTLARPGDAVLLSPACASFDGFTDFEHRGRHFAALAEATP